MSKSRVNSIVCHSSRSEESAAWAPQGTADSSSHSLLGMTICLFLFFLLTVSNYAENRVCNPAQSQRADAAVDTVHSWDSLYKWYRSYVQCDDGSAAEGVSEAVARNLVDRWKSLRRFSQLAKSDPRFRAFVFKHIDTTLNENDLKKIHSNASTRCPVGLRSLCDSIRKQTGSS